MQHRFFIAVFAAVAVTGCAHSPPSDPIDPLEPVNRGIYKFNDVADDYVMRPIAQAYVDYTPDPIERGIGNFLDNLRYPIVIANDLFQLKLRQGADDFARLLINSTIGVLGIFDVAGSWGLEYNDEDFGQTLGYWGLGQGVYLVLPFLGPSTGRDLTGDVVDQFMDPVTYIDDTAVQYSLIALYLLDLRASLLGFERTVENAFDPYLFVRGAYLENRLSKVYDGKPPRELREPRD